MFHSPPRSESLLHIRHYITNQRGSTPGLWLAEFTARRDRKLRGQRVSESEAQWRDTQIFVLMKNSQIADELMSVCSDSKVFVWWKGLLRPQEWGLSDSSTGVQCAGVSCSLTWGAKHRVGKPCSGSPIYSSGAVTALIVNTKWCICVYEDKKGNLKVFNAKWKEIKSLMTQSKWT